MKQVLVFVSLIALFACNSNKSANNNGKSDLPENLLEKNSISNLVSINHLELEKIKGNFETFKLYLNQLDDDRIVSIAFALDYINTCISVNSDNQDSIFLLFEAKFYEVANKLTDSLETQYKSIMELLFNGESSPEIDNLKSNLKTCGMALFSTEGNYYIDVVFDYFYNNFQHRVSDGLKAYLDIRKDELKQGFSEDAGLVISFEELYQRIIKWEQFLDKFPPSSIYTQEANYYFSVYLSTLITGMDNSRVFDYESNSLLPEVKQLYEKIITETNDSKTKQIISSYYALLARHDFKDNDSIAVFFKENNVTSMLATQPHTR